MSHLRAIQKALDPEAGRARAVTFSYPTWMGDVVDSLMKHTGGSRSAVLQALIRDGLLAYYMQPFEIALSEAQDALENASGSVSIVMPDEMSEVDPDFDGRPVPAEEVPELYEQAKTFYSRKVSRP